MKFYGWPWKTIGHLLYAHSSFMHHLVAIDEFQFELQSGNGQIGFWPLWPWPLTSDGQTDGRTDGQDHSYSCLVAAKIAVTILCIGSTFGNIYSKYAIVYCGYHFSFDYVCSSAIMYIRDNDVFGHGSVSKSFNHCFLRYEPAFLGWTSCPMLPYFYRSLDCLFKFFPSDI